MRSAWAGRPVLVTGHTGFKGSWLCWWLTRLGAEVSGIALAPATQPSLFEASGLASEMRSGIQDVRDAAGVLEAFRAHRPEVVFHLAAQSLVREGYRRPAETFDTNVSGTVHCLEAARHCESVRAVVVVTSDKCYEERPLGRPFVEEDPLGGHDPYAASKACAEIVTHAYRRSYFEAGPVLLASVRAGNVIGGGDWSADRLVPDAVRAFSSGTELRLRSPAAVRPWQHVLEPLRGYLLVAERLLRGERSAATAWNLGPDQADARPVAWVVEQLARRWGPQARWSTEQKGDHPRETPELTLDAGKASRELGWRPLLPLEQGLDWAVDWYRTAASGASAKTVTLEQIERYEALAPP